MMVSALVLTLSDDPSVRARVLDDLRRHPRLSLGEPVDRRLPVVAETEDAGQGASLCEALGEWPGVVCVDVVSIQVDENDENDEDTSPWGEREESCS